MYGRILTVALTVIGQCTIPLFVFEENILLSFSLDQRKL